MTSYYLSVFDTSGDLQAVLTDFTSLSYNRKVNAPGLLQFTLPGDHDLLKMIGDKYQVEVWRKPEGGQFGRELIGIMRNIEYYYSDRSKAVLTCPGLMSMLGWRIVNWYAGTNNRSAFTAKPAETIMKTLVDYNAGSAATTGNGRLRNGAIAGLTVEADGANGNSKDWNCAYDNLLETLQDLALIAGGDFDLVKTSSTSWQFCWYTGQLGEDRTAKAVFTLERGNMANPQYKVLRMGAKTVCTVGGRGEGSARVTAIRTGADYSADNDIEMFANAVNCETTAGLQAAGDAALKDKQARESFGFDVLQTPATRYGMHYTLGDLVTAINPYTGGSMTLKITEASVSYTAKGEEKVAIQMTAL